jgi:hypothetical protein
MQKQAIPMSEQSHHLLIGGTGRSGTTMLVEYLTKLGMDTHLSRNPESTRDENAQAGHEDMLLNGDPASMPYVVKDPWLYEYADQVLCDPRIKIDGLIIPLRNLMDAATSRVVVEMHSIHQTQPWMGELDVSWKNFGKVPGGIIYSLKAEDQARILAVGFHEIIERFVKSDIPLYFIHLEKIVKDRSYLYNKLRPVLPPATTLEHALAAYDAVVDKAKIRAGSDGEMQAAPTDALHATNDRSALVREIRRLNQELLALRKARRQLGNAAGPAGVVKRIRHSGSELIAAPLRSILRRIRRRSREWLTSSDAQ